MHFPKNRRETPPRLKRLRWHYRHWRAKHYAWEAYMDWYRHPSDAARERWARAVIHQDHVFTQGP